MDKRADTSDTPQKGLLGGLPRLVQWLLVLVVSAVLTALIELAGLPAALLLGPMIGGIVAGANGADIRVHPLPFAGAQGVVGVMIAAALAPELFYSFFDDWALILGSVAATVFASSLLGWLISRWKILPGTTGVWGFAPGAASAMVLMAEAFGADVRLVAFIQYLRVIFVTVTAAVVAGLWVDTSGAEAPAIVWFPAIEWLPFATTLLVAACGTWFGRLLRLPAPNFLGVMLLGIILHLGAGLSFQLPEWLLAASYALVGWTIGLRFDRRVLIDAARKLPQIVAAIVALIVFSGGIAWVLANELGIDPLTAYLATSPGGMDSVAIIAAAAGNLDISFIMALQMMRFLIVLVAGPPLARLVASWVKE